jgi:CubicO group peptidase (beta-lactamase class C family)
VTTRAVIDGFVAPGYEPVADAFAKNIVAGSETGAAFAVYQHEKPIVDLWGGMADRASGTPWVEDTLQPIFSGTKGLVAICLLLLIERGELELAAPVCRYWSEFAANGKETIRVSDVVSHTARLPGVDTPITLDDFTDGQRMAAILAEQAPSADPRARLAYHAFTYGWLCGELIRRVDGMSLGRFFAEEVAEPLQLELWIGLPDQHEDRVATLELAENWPVSSHLDSAVLRGDTLLKSIWGNPPVLSKTEFPWNRRDFHAAEVAGAGAIGTARSIARLYANLEALLRPETIALGRMTLSAGWDKTVSAPQRFGVGFQLSTDLGALGPAADAFGHGGAGGSIHGSWPGERLGFSYGMNLMRDDEAGVYRSQRLLIALHRSLIDHAISWKVPPALAGEDGWTGGRLPSSPAG